MALTETLPAASALAGVLAQRPELLTKYRTFHQSFWRDGLVPRRVLELCRLRIAYIHDCPAEIALGDAHTPLTDDEREALRLGQVEAFGAAEQAALQLAEHMPYAVHNITDDWVAQADEYFGHAGAVALLTALAFFDVTCRLKLVLDLPVEAHVRDDDHLI